MSIINNWIEIVFIYKIRIKNLKIDMEKIEPHNYIKRNDEVFANELDHEIVMMHLDTGKYYGLDEIGTRIWKLIEQKIQVKEIVAQLVQEYSVNEHDCTTDVIDLLNDLWANDLIVVK